MTEVVVYTKENCGPCSMVKRWLDNNDIEYTTKTAQDALDKGYRSVPVTEYGPFTAIGFNPRKLFQIKENYFGIVR